MDRGKVLIRARGMERDSERVVRRLGRTGFEVNVLGVGGHTYPIGSGPGSFMSPDERAQLIRHLVSAGVNYFDTTYIEELELLADSFRRAEIKENVLVSLYGGCILDAQWHQKLRSEVESRLDITGYSHAPLLIANVGNGDASYADVVAACESMTRLKEESLVKNIGLSCHAISLFPTISRAIRETDMIDYIMIRFNWKSQQANEELFPVADAHDVGIVVMKIFYWDCFSPLWERRISVFEPAGSESRIEDNSSLSPAQRNLLWCIQNSPCDVIVPSMNSMREVEENIQALRSINKKAGVEDFEEYGNRLFKKKELKKLALYAGSNTIRERARVLWKPRRLTKHLLMRTVKVHYRILRDEGLKKYLLISYRYRKDRISGWIRKLRA